MGQGAKVLFIRRFARANPETSTQELELCVDTDECTYLLPRVDFYERTLSSIAWPAPSYEVRVYDRAGRVGAGIRRDEAGKKGRMGRRGPERGRAR